MKRISAYLFLFTFTVLAACTPEPWGTKWDAEIEKPGVIVRVNEPNLRIIDLPSGISVFETKENGKISTQYTDSSGNGAVLCNWDIIVHARNYINKCYPKKYRQRKKELDKAIDKINDFIVSNSMSPVTREQLQVAAKNRDLGKKKCGDSTLEHMSRDYLELSTQELNANIDNLLSVPRFPVYDPCL